jgi:hypothetical protein
MIANPVRTPIQRELTAQMRPAPVEIPKTSPLVARRTPTGSECGLGSEAGAVADTRCRDIIPELMTELL